jgi:hypothetical protein
MTVTRPTSSGSTGFADAISAAYATEGDAIDLGRAVHEGGRAHSNGRAGLARSREGKALQRGLFGMLRKRL